MSDLLVRKSALISPCGTYRYRLTREWGLEPPLPFVMLNPSTADAEVDDPTIRRCMGFARREGAGGIVVVNLFALRSPSPKALKVATVDPVGPENERQLHDLVHESIAAGRPIVCAWGAHDRGQFLVARMQAVGARLVCLGITKDGHPRHPLYVAGNQPLTPYPAHLGTDAAHRGKEGREL